MRRAITIGRYTDLSLARAKHKASEIELDISEGLDPLIEKERDKNGQIITVNDLAEDWFKECDVRLKNPPIPHQVYRNYIHPSLGKHAVKNVSTLDTRHSTLDTRHSTLDTRHKV